MLASIHHLWAQGFYWLAPPYRLCLFALVAFLILGKVVPVLLQRLGRSLAAGATPGLMLLTYPEYLLSSAFRRREKPVPRVVFAYDQGLGVVAAGAHRCARALQSLGRHRAAFPRRSAGVITVLVIAVWYSGRLSLPPNLSQTSASARTDLAAADVWLATGTWTTPLGARASWCGPVESTPSPTAPKKPKKHSRTPPKKAGSKKVKPTTHASKKH